MLGRLAKGGVSGRDHADDRELCAVAGAQQARRRDPKIDRNGRSRYGSADALRPAPRLDLGVASRQVAFEAIRPGSCSVTAKVATANRAAAGIRGGHRANSPRHSATAWSPRRRCASSTAIPFTWIRQPAARCGGISAIDRRRAADRAHLRRARRADHSVRRRLLARRPRQRAARRRVDRLPRHEQGARGSRRGSRLRRPARHHPQGAQRAAARQRPVLSDRSRRRRLARRHGGDARLRHQRGALRHHEGQRAGAEGGAWRTAR